VIGDAERMRAAGSAGSAGGGPAAKLVINQIADPEAGKYTVGSVDCLHLGLIPPNLPWGKISAEAGDAAFRFIQTATNLAMAGRVDAICTAPLNKEALHLGGH